MPENQHSIQKVFLEIDTPSMPVANSIKESIAMFLEKELVPVFEKQFNLTENTGHQILQIEKLEISIHINPGKTDLLLSNSEVKNDIKNQIEKEIHKALSKVKINPNDDKKNTYSSQEKNIKTLLYFIENGSMPWWVSKDEVTFLEKINFENIEKDAFRIPFRLLMQQKKNQNRIINQFSNQEIALFTSALFDSEKNKKILLNYTLLQFLNTKSHEFKTSFWQLVFDQKKPMEIISFYHQKQNEFFAEKMNFELFIQNLTAVFPLNTTNSEFKRMNDNYLKLEKIKSTLKSESEENNSSLSSDIQSKKEENFQEEKTNLKSAYVQNAGLIILHPFLKEMLKNCGLIGDNNTLLNKELAAHILHYAATKSENDYEHTMLFEKFLCGIPIQESIKREVKIEEKHKKQVEEMLRSVVEHWSALKNTSTTVLRTEFLQREGKLDWSESNPKLTIERKTQDLLLEKIPWNITIIKISWIEKLIYTQW